MTDAQALRKINKNVAKAIRATMKAEKAYQRIKGLEEQLEAVKQQKLAAYQESERYYAEAQDDGLEWAVIQIGEALQYGGTIEAYLQELLSFAPEDYARLLTS